MTDLHIPPFASPNVYYFGGKEGKKKLGKRVKAILGGKYVLGRPNVGSGGRIVCSGWQFHCLASVPRFSL